MIKIDDPAFVYNSFGQKYSGSRQTDPRIAEHIFEALDGMNTVLNVGAGAGSYEPFNRHVTAVEPSKVMREQRLKNGRPPAVNATAEELPFDDNSFDGAMAMVTVHHWYDLKKGLNEIKRVSKNRVVVMTFDPDCQGSFWNADYFPELVEIEQARFPKIEVVMNTLGGNCKITSIPIPLDCVDGFQEAFYGRPEAFLNKEVRVNQSAWGFLADGVESKIVKRLEADLKSGTWDRKHSDYRTLPTLTGALKLIVATL